MILVTGAGGKTGRAVVAALSRDGASVRALVRQASSQDSLLQLGAAEAVTADLRSATDLRRVMDGVESVYHICPNMHPDEVPIGRTVIRAAREAGARRLVLHSVLHPQAQAMPHHGNKLRVEEALIESGLDFTLLRPTAYMQNLLAGWSSILDRGRLLAPYPPETRLSLVDLEDVAQAASKVMRETTHSAAAYDLVGTLPLSQHEVAQVFSHVLGRRVEAQQETIDAWDRRARVSGLGRRRRRMLRAMFLYYARYGLSGNQNTLRWILGHEAADLVWFIERSLRERSGAGSAD